MIPRTQESDDQRKRRVMQEHIDTLEAQLANYGPVQAVQNSELPRPVAVALNWTAHFQQMSQPIVAHVYDEPEFAFRPVLDSELAAADAAFDLIREYFDQHNPRYMAAYRKEAEKVAKAGQPKGKKS